jgi:hypothetical protein
MIPFFQPEPVQPNNLALGKVTDNARKARRIHSVKDALGTTSKEKRKSLSPAEATGTLVQFCGSPFRAE